MTMSKNKNYHIEKILTALFIMSVPMTPLFTMYGFYFLGTIQIIMFLYFQTQYDNFRKPTVFEKYYLLFVIFTFVSFVWAPHRSIGFMTKILTNFLFVIATVQNFRFFFKKIDYSIDFFARFFILGTIIISLYCLVVEQPFGLLAERMGTFVFEDPYGTYMTYSYCLEISVFFIIYLLLKKKRVAFNSAILSFIILCILLNGTRKIFVGILVFYLVYSWFDDRKRFFSLLMKIILLCISIIIIYYVVINNATLYAIFGQRIENYLMYMELSEGNVEADGSAIQRAEMIEYALKLFESSPIWGNGADSFRFLYKKFSGELLYSHNTYTELLCNGGIIGFSLYYIYYILVLKKLVVKTYSSYYSNFFIASLVSLLVLDYWTISYFRIHFLFFLAMASMYCNERPKMKIILKENYII